MFLLLVCIAMIGVWSLVNFRPNVRSGQALVRVSPETTYLEGPLDANGDVAYLEALNLELAKGVTPENNSVVKFIQGFGGIAEGRFLEKEFFDRIGIAPPNRGALRYLNFYDWMESKGITQASGGQYDELSSQWDFAGNAPWSADDFPELSRWIEDVGPVAELFREGSLRPRYYHPLIVEAGDQQRVIEGRLSMVQMMREIARFQSRRAMLKLEQGEVDAAFEDLLTTLRIGILVRQGGTLIEDLVGIAIQGIAISNVSVICASGKPSSEELKRFLSELEKLPTPNHIGHSLQLAERFMLLDIIVAVGRGETVYLDYMNGQMKPNRSATSSLIDVALKAVDWEECMIVANRWYDRISEVAETEDLGERRKGLAKLELELSQMAAKSRQPSNIALTVIGGRRAKGQAMAEILIAMLTPALQQVSAAETRIAAQMELAKVAVAVSAYKADHGSFPKSLGLLVPNYFDELPLDPCSRRPLKFSIEPNELGEDVVSLYSVGENGLDDGGMGDDLMVDWNVIDWDLPEEGRGGSLNAWYENDVDDESLKESSNSQTNSSDGEKIP